MKSRIDLDIESLEKRTVLSSWMAPKILSSWMAPKINATKQITIDEDSTSAIVLKVRDLDSKRLRVELSVSGGRFLTQIDNRLAISNNSNTVRIQGKQSDINRYFKFYGLKYEPIKDSNATENLIIKAFDKSRRATFKSKIIINPVNDSPTISSPQVIDSKDGFISWKSPTFTDIDSQNIVVRLYSENIEINDPSANFVKKSEFVEINDTVLKINELFSSGKVKISSKSTETDLKLSVSDGFSNVEQNIIVHHKRYLSDESSYAVVSRTNEKNPEISKNIYSIMDHDKKIYVRNQNNWAYDLDLSMISPWNSAGGGRLGGTLISPRHIVFATHYQIPIGAKLRFVTKDNVVIEKTLVNKISPSYTNVYFPDITVGVLDSDVPSSISFAKILPDNWDLYLKTFDINVPCLVLDQEEKALVSNVHSITPTYMNFVEPPNKSFFEKIIGGDSGNPAFLIVDDEPILLTIWTFGGAGSGTSIAGQKMAINRMMKELGGEYQLSEINLDRFIKLD